MAVVNDFEQKKLTKNQNSAHGTNIYRLIDNSHKYPHPCSQYQPSCLDPSIDLNARSNTIPNQMTSSPKTTLVDQGYSLCIDPSFKTQQQQHITRQKSHLNHPEQFQSNADGFGEDTRPSSAIPDSFQNQTTNQIAASAFLQPHTHPSHNIGSAYNSKSTYEHKFPWLTLTQCQTTQSNHMTTDVVFKPKCHYGAQFELIDTEPVAHAIATQYNHEFILPLLHVHHTHSMSNTPTISHQFPISRPSFPPTSTLVLPRCLQGDLTDFSQQHLIRQMMHDESVSSINTVHPFITQLLILLDYIHNVHSLAHHDIKLENFVVNSNTPLLTDFGFSQTYQPQMSQNHPHMDPSMYQLYNLAQFRYECNAERFDLLAEQCMVAFQPTQLQQTLVPKPSTLTTKSPYIIPLKRLQHLVNNHTRIIQTLSSFFSTNPLQAEIQLCQIFQIATLGFYTMEYNQYTNRRQLNSLVVPNLPPTQPDSFANIYRNYINNIQNLAYSPISSSPSSMKMPFSTFNVEDIYVQLDPAFIPSQCYPWLSTPITKYLNFTCYEERCTKYYAPPELYLLKYIEQQPALAYNPFKSDVFSLGVTILSLLLGINVFHEELTVFSTCPGCHRTNESRPEPCNQCHKNIANVANETFRNLVNQFSLKHLTQQGDISEEEFNELLLAELCDDKHTKGPLFLPDGKTLKQIFVNNHPHLFKCVAKMLHPVPSIRSDARTALEQWLNISFE